MHVRCQPQVDEVAALRAELARLTTREAEQAMRAGSLAEVERTVEESSSALAALAIFTREVRVVRRSVRTRGCGVQADAPAH